MLIGLCSLKSSPGVTTTAIALAAAWPATDPKPTIIESDAHGGDIAVRFHVAEDPGLRSLAAASRLKPDAALLHAHTRRLGPAALPMVTAPHETEQARHAVTALNGLLDLLRETPEPALLDLGQIDPKDLNTADLLTNCAVVLVVSRSAPDQVQRVQSAAQDLLAVNKSTKVVLVGGGKAREIHNLTGLPIAATIPSIAVSGSILTRWSERKARQSFGTQADGLASQLALLRPTDTNARSLIHR
ncbi:hypothetical protein KGQ19_00585 [Catenulispora sp. NL8]|uniref:MinD-like ATPase involved in chromosome partitioning or flagellar assembly n=1 Tax=Catenulispora pinistramenti TaxID=2705254 RepID=A0ABS5KH99_9ACTN|nr:hypothetical protein [Catenulispora pinistramenti]MBS2545355.1 hypothetical protein [Catenulispora pinistramenti]